MNFNCNRVCIIKFFKSKITWNSRYIRTNFKPVKSLSIFIWGYNKLSYSNDTKLKTHYTIILRSKKGMLFLVKYSL